MKAISIPEKNAHNIKQLMIIVISMFYFELFLASNFLANFLLKKNIKTESAAIAKNRKCSSVSALQTDIAF
jgi:hypothetical protein